MPSSILVTDFETVPDFSQLPQITGSDEGQDTITGKLERLKRYMKEDKGQDEKEFFPSLSLHRILVSSFIYADIVYDGQMEVAYKPKNFWSVDSDESAMLHSMVPWLDKVRPRFVTYNGRSFEIPLLKLRCLRHKVQCGFFLASGDKYDNYDSRYSSNWHCDMMDVLSGHGAARFLKLREACALANLPGKLFGSGRDVLKMWMDGEMQAIKSYCEMDVLETFLLYVTWQHVRGMIPFDGYTQSIVHTIQLLKSSQNPHIPVFLDEWGRLDQYVKTLL